MSGLQRRLAQIETRLDQERELVVERVALAYETERELMKALGEISRLVDESNDLPPSDWRPEPALRVEIDATESDFAAKHGLSPRVWVWRFQQACASTDGQLWAHKLEQAAERELAKVRAA